MADFELVAQSRGDMGKANARRMRREQGRIPGVIYGAKKDSASISLNHNEVVHALENEAFYSHILTLNVDGKAEQVVLKDLQRHPYKPSVLHVDFLRVDSKLKLTMHIPLHFINEETAVGVKMEGGIVGHHLNEVEVSCLPADLPEYIEVDLANVKLDEVLHLTDLKLPKGVELTVLGQAEPNDLAVVSIHTAKAAEEIPTDAPEAPETEVEQGSAEEASNEE